MKPHWVEYGTDGLCLGIFMLAGARFARRSELVPCAKLFHAVDVPCIFCGHRPVTASTIITTTESVS